MSAELQAAHIDASFNGLADAAWNADVADGKFGSHDPLGNSAVSPYGLYNYWLNSTLDNGTGNRRLRGSEQPDPGQGPVEAGGRRRRRPRSG